MRVYVDEIYEFQFGTYHRPQDTDTRVTDPSQMRNSRRVCPPSQTNPKWPGLAIPGKLLAAFSIGGGCRCLHAVCTR